MIRNIVFVLIVSSFIVLFSTVTLISEKNTIVSGENRSAAHFEDLSVEGYFQNETQKNIEESFADQFLLREYFISRVANLDAKIKDILYPRTSYDDYEIVTIDEFYYLVNDRIFLEKKPSTGLYQTEVTKFLTNPEYASRMMKQNAEFHNLLSEYADVFVYEPYNSIYMSNQLDGDTTFLDFQSEYLSYLNGDVKYAKLVVNNLEEFDSYYYSVDHHWNDEGVKQAYSDILDLMNITTPSTISYDEKHCIEEIEFRGTHVRRSGYTDYYENPCFYTFIETETYTVNNVEKSLNAIRIDYANGIFMETRDQNKYWDFYTNINNRMYDLVINYHDDSKENLLILGDSYSRGMYYPLSSHFNETHVFTFNNLDRDEDHDLHIDPNIRQYIIANEIDKILIMPYYYHIYMRESNFRFE